MGRTGLANIGVEVRHTHERAIAKRSEGIQDIIRGERAIHPLMQQSVGRGDAARDIVRHIPPHQIEVGRRQHGDVHADVGQPPGDRHQLGRRHHGELGHVADRDLAAEPVLLGEVEVVEPYRPNMRKT